MGSVADLECSVRMDGGGGGAQLKISDSPHPLPKWRKGNIIWIRGEGASTIITYCQFLCTWVSKIICYFGKGLVPLCPRSTIFTAMFNNSLDKCMKYKVCFQMFHNGNDLAARCAVFAIPCLVQG